MNTKSKYSLYFYAIIGVILFLKVLLCALLLFFLNNNHYLLSIIPIVSIFLFGRLAQKYYKTFPPVTITNTEIFIGFWMWSKRISIDDVCEFQLTDSFPISRWISGGGVTSGFSIRTKADEEYIFYEKYYKNPHELRARFAQVTNTNFVPRNSAIDNPFTSLTTPLSSAIEKKMFFVGLIVALVGFYLLNMSVLFAFLFIISFLLIYVSVSTIYESKRDCITIEVEGKEIRFKYNFPFSRVITENLNDIITCNLSFFNVKNGYSGFAFCYISSDYRRIVIKESNLESDVLDELIIILEKNGVPVTDFRYES